MCQYYCAIPHKLVWEKGATLSKLGLRGMLVRYFVKIEIYLAAEIIIIYQELFSPKSAFFSKATLNNHFVVRAPSTSYNQMHPL